MNKGKLVIGVLSSLGLSGQVYADELDFTSIDWSGAYFGVHGGMSIFDGDIVSTGRNVGTFDFDTTNGTVGVHLGWHIQQDELVFGVEGDFGYLGLDESVNFPAGKGSTAVASDNTWISTVRIKAGVAQENTLFYLTGGLALTENELKATRSGIAVSSSEILTGYTVGGGLAFQLAEGWIGRVEYLYSDFEENYVTNGGTISNSVDLNVQEVRFGLSLPLP